MPREISAGAVIFRKENNQILYLLLHYEAGPVRGYGNREKAQNQRTSNGAGHWDFPKGNVEEGEKEEETVRREVREETGIEDIKIIKGFRELINYFYRKTYKLPETRSRAVGPRSGLGKAPWVFKIVTYYLAETKTKEVKTSFEHLGYEWLPYEQALKEITYKNAKEVLKKAHQFLEKNY